MPGAGAVLLEETDCEVGALACGWGACCWGAERVGSETLGAGDNLGVLAPSNDAGRSLVERTVEAAAFWSVTVLVASLLLAGALLFTETLLPISDACFAVLLCFDVLL